LTLEEDFQAVLATWDDIKQFQWDKLEINIICEN
jgi:hypothetical protein